LRREKRGKAFLFYERRNTGRGGVFLLTEKGGKKGKGEDPLLLLRGREKKCEQKRKEGVTTYIIMGGKGSSQILS